MRNQIKFYITIVWLFLIVNFNSNDIANILVSYIFIYIATQIKIT